MSLLKISGPRAQRQRLRSYGGSRMLENLPHTAVAVTMGGVAMAMGLAFGVLWVGVYSLPWALASLSLGVLSLVVVPFLVLRLIDASSQRIRRWQVRVARIRSHRDRRERPLSWRRRSHWRGRVRAFPEMAWTQDGEAAVAYERRITTAPGASTVRCYWRPFVVAGDGFEVLVWPRDLQLCCDRLAANEEGVTMVLNDSEVEVVGFAQRLQPGSELDRTWSTLDKRPTAGGYRSVAFHSPRQQRYVLQSAPFRAVLIAGVSTDDEGAAANHEVHWFL